MVTRVLLYVGLTVFNCELVIAKVLDSTLYLFFSLSTTRFVFEVCWLDVVVVLLLLLLLQCASQSKCVQIKDVFIAR